MNTKILLTSIAALAMCCPVIADPVTPNIAVGTNPASCNESVLETTSGTSNLEANWTANTLNLKWYDDVDGNEINPTNPAAATCTYDSGITVPTNSISKTGYTFAGWQVKVATPAQPQQTGFDLSTLNANTSGIDYASKNFAGDYCYYYNNDTGDEIDTEECSEYSVFSDLSTGEWKTNFSYGQVSGIAYCSGKSGNNHSWQWGGNSSDWTATESELTSASGEKKYCWCKATNYTPLNGTEQSVASSSWVFDNGSVSADNCAFGCASACASRVSVYDDFRRAVFGIMQ